MELRSVEELMDLLYACRGAWNSPDLPRARPRPGAGTGAGDPVDLHDHALQTSALLRRGRPSDKELQVAGLVHDIGQRLRPGDDNGHADRAADAVQGLLGERVSRLVRLQVVAGRYLATTSPGRGLSARSALTPAEVVLFERDPLAEDAVTLRQADDAAKAAGLDAGVLEDWRTVLELVAGRHSRLGAVD